MLSSRLYAVCKCVNLYIYIYSHTCATASTLRWQTTHIHTNKHIFNGVTNSLAVEWSAEICSAIQWYSLFESDKRSRWNDCVQVLIDNDYPKKPIRAVEKCKLNAHNQTCESENAYMHSPSAELDLINWHFIASVYSRNGRLLPLLSAGYFPNRNHRTDLFPTPTTDGTVTAN